MNWVVNPFSELYPTEKIEGDEFVDLFSNSLINSATNLYGKGNIILEGVQGSGKSMLLALLKPEIRLAYIQNKTEYPVPDNFSNFISCGINLTQDGAKSFSNLRPGKRIRAWQEELPLYFADYFNYRVVRSLLKTLLLYKDHRSSDIAGLKININNDKLDEFAVDLSSKDCWFDYLNGVSSFEDLVDRVGLRLKEYRFLLGLNKREPSEGIKNSKTSIGSPIFELYGSLTKAGIVDKECNFIVYIDQYEELDHMCAGDDDILVGFRSIINQALHLRDDRASFKIGTRGYAWKNNKDVFGTYSQIEEGRDYQVIKLYDLLRRREHSRGQLFKQLCNEIFDKRLAHAGITLPENEASIFDYVFGNTEEPSEKAKIYGGSKPAKVIKYDKGWSDEWTCLLKKLSEENPLSAHLGAAWSRQKDKSSVVTDVPELNNLPWEAAEKKYWKKERTQQSLFQMASNRKQSILLYGTKDILGLSGANVLSFLTICQKVWAIYISDMTRSTKEPQALPQSIDKYIQSAGIKEASRTWFDKISELPGGSQRKLFVDKLGQQLSKKFYNDIAMSNPGATGISLTIEDLEANFALYRMLDNCTDYSVLDQKPHTTKLADKKPRIKFYLEPILCPFFKLPYQQTKEPVYANAAGISPLITGGFIVENSSEQLGLDFS